MTSNILRYLIRSEGTGEVGIQAEYESSVDCRRYYVQKDRFTSAFGCKVPPLYEDLIDLALTVYAADRLAPRRPDKAQDGHRWWQRDFKIQVMVSDPGRWAKKEIRQPLSELLGFFTEDLWDIEFLPRSGSQLSKSVQGALFEPKVPVVVSLFSGGLDSLAGLALELAQEGAASVVIVTCSTSSRMLRRQRELIELFCKNSKTQIVPVIVPLRIGQNRSEYNKNERSQRSRGFLFGILGCVVALLAGGNHLSIYENGIGAINLPISAAQLGAQSTRSSSPVALRKMELVIRALLEVDFSFRLPFLFETKGEMCGKLKNSRYSDLAFRSISCDGFPPRLVGSDHCGICTSCLLRRQSLWTAGFSGDCEERRYRYDVLTETESLRPEQLAPLWDMLSQVEAIANALRSIRPWNSLVAEYPELLEVREVLVDRQEQASRSLIEDRIARLYRTYCDEWLLFPARPAGWAFDSSALTLTA